MMTNVTVYLMRPTAMVESDVVVVVVVVAAAVVAINDARDCDDGGGEYDD